MMTVLRFCSWCVRYWAAVMDPPAPMNSKTSGPLRAAIRWSRNCSSPRIAKSAPSRAGVWAMTSPPQSRR